MFKHFAHTKLIYKFIFRALIFQISIYALPNIIDMQRLRAPQL